MKYKTIYKCFNDDFAEIYTIPDKKKSPRIDCGFFNSTDKLEIERISLSRTKKNIRELLLCNDFQFFSTVTVNSLNADRFSLEECQSLLKCKLKKIKRLKKNFIYLFITEKHKNGAFHFHGMMSDTRRFIC